MLAKTAAPSASASRVASTVRPRAPNSLGGAGVAVRRSEAAPLRSEFLGATGLAGLCSAVAGMALESSRAAVRLISPFMVECNNKKGKGATVAKTTNRKRARVSGFRVRMQTPAGRRVIKARRAKGRKILAPGSVFGGK